MLHPDWNDSEEYYYNFIQGGFYLSNNYAKMHHLPMYRRAGKRKGMTIREYHILPFPKFMKKRAIW